MTLATTFPVTKTADTADGACNADCSLREAIIAANANPGLDVIQIPASATPYTLTTPGTGENAAATGDLDITQEVIIQGAGAATTIIDGGDLDRVFHILPGVTGSVNFNDVTIRNGTTLEGTGTNGRGGGIFIESSIQVDLSFAVVTSNVVGPGASGNGGGIYTQASLLRLTNSTVSNNVAGDQGGGIFSAGGTLALIRSTVSGNSNQDQGAGIFNLNGPVTIDNSTISNNIGTDNGGGFYNNGPSVGANTVTITISTIADNSSGSAGGGGIYNLSGNMTVLGSIVANNTGGSAPQCTGTSITFQSSLIESTAGCAFTGTNNIIGVDPALLPLGNNGGPTQTRALTSGSQAINTFACSPGQVKASDQRGFTRPAGAACDMGAFECQVTECTGGGPAPTATATVPAATATVTPTRTNTPPTGPAATATPTRTNTPPTGPGGPTSPVPTLSFPMLALLGIALAATAVFLMKRA